MARLLMARDVADVAHLLAVRGDRGDARSAECVQALVCMLRVRRRL
jgi:hypothetical protein